MAKKSQKEKASPGVSLHDFEAGVRALVKLRDSGKCLFFLPRQNWLRIVMDDSDFEHAILDEVEGRKIDEDQTKDILGEIRRYLGALVRFQDQRLAIRYAIEALYGGEDEDTGEREPDSALRELVEQKISLLREQLLTETLTQRARRLKTAVGPSLEELDIDVVASRHDRIAETQIQRPFARLRLRYSELTPNLLPFPFFLFPPPYVAGVPVPSFELECDASDIDFLIKRLLDAKRKLLDSVERPGED